MLSLQSPLEWGSKFTSLPCRSHTVEGFWKQIPFQREESWLYKVNTGTTVIFPKEMCSRSTAKWVAPCGVGCIHFPWICLELCQLCIHCIVMWAPTSSHSLTLSAQVFLHCHWSLLLWDSSIDTKQLRYQVWWVWARYLNFPFTDSQFCIIDR